MTITAEHLHALLERVGEDPAGLARRAQLDPNNLNVYLTGRGQPCPTEQRRLALALHVTIGELHDDPDRPAL